MHSLPINAILTIFMIFSGNQDRAFFAFTAAFALVILGDILLMALALMGESGPRF